MIWSVLRQHLVLRVDLGGRSHRGRGARLSRGALAAFEHQDALFEVLVERLNLGPLC